MRRRLLLWFLVVFVHHSLAFAQQFSKLTTSDGLNNNSVYAITRDKDGFVWFLTSEGVNRYDGLAFVNIPLGTKNIPVGINSIFNLITDHNGDVWQVGTNFGNTICRYGMEKGKFVDIYLQRAGKSGLRFLFLDDENRIWMSSAQALFFYDINSGKQVFIDIKMQGGHISCGAQYDKNAFVVGTTKGLFTILHEGDQWIVRRKMWKVKWMRQDIESEIYDKFTPQNASQIPASKIFANPNTGNFIVFDTKSRYYFIDRKKKEVKGFTSSLLYDTPVMDINISVADDKCILLATAGKGIFQLNCETGVESQFLTYNPSEISGLSGNIVMNILTEPETRRMWIANYPYGVCCYRMDFPTFTYRLPSEITGQSILPGVVTGVIEDSDGDIWYSTGRGVSCHDRKSDSWRHFLTERNGRSTGLLLSLCEIRPGLILVTGMMSGGFVINKKTGEIQEINPRFFGEDMVSDRGIHSVYKDDQGIVWVAGEHFLGRIDWDKKSYRSYEFDSFAVHLSRKDSSHFWLATMNGLRQVDDKTCEMKEYKLPQECVNINSVLTASNGDLYIGTTDAGLFVKKAGCKETDPKKAFINYRTDNSALLSDNILSLVEDAAHTIVMGTGRGLARFYPEKKNFFNWVPLSEPSKNGCMKNSLLHTSDNLLIAGMYRGTVEFEDSIRLPHSVKSRMIFYNLKVNGEDRSPLKDFDSLKLSYSERQISFFVGNLGFDNPYEFLYSWHLEGSGEKWNAPTRNTRIRYLLPSGSYRLVVRAHNSADNKVVEERIVHIRVSPPWWRSIYANIFYILVLIGIGYAVYNYMRVRNKHKTAEDKVNFFIQTAHEIRTPLTLIKAPLEEISRKEELTERGHQNLRTALRSANDLLILTGDLLNLERQKIHVTNLQVSLADLTSYLQELIIPFQLYARTKRQDLLYTSVTNAKVWLDRSRMDSILQNLINNALKYTKEGGCVEVSSSVLEDHWSISVSDNGIGIPKEEQSKLMEMYFRSHNANSSAGGTGVGLYLVKKLVEEHHGSITFVSEEGEGTTFTLTFPLNYDNFKNVDKLSPESGGHASKVNAPTVLVVEDNTDLRSFLSDSLSEFYNVCVAENGMEAYDKVRFLNPTIVVSDVMMPQMRGDELCRRLKSEVETSHIPVILLTALADKDSVVGGLSTLADAYLTKPFSVSVLKAQIDNIIANRKSLQKLYASAGRTAEPASTVPDTRKSEAVETPAQNDNNVATAENATVPIANELDLNFMKSVNGILDRHISESAFTIDVLCTEIGMSRTSFYNKLKSLTGYPPADFLRMRRIEKSKDLLLHSSLSIAEISDVCGFGDAKYFREVFKRNLGKSPRQFRNNEC